EGLIPVVGSGDDPRVGELVAVHDPPRDLPAFSLGGRAGELVGQCFDHVVQMPARLGGVDAGLRVVEVDLALGEGGDPCPAPAAAATVPPRAGKGVGRDHAGRDHDPA